MSSHIRYLLKDRGAWFKGTEALGRLSFYRGPVKGPVKSVLDAVRTADRIGIQLWVFREPRRTVYQRSQYQKLCSYLGLGNKKKKAAGHLYIADAPPAQVAGNAIVEQQIFGLGQALGHPAGMWNHPAPPVQAGPDEP